MGSGTKKVAVRLGMTGATDWYAFTLANAQFTTIDLAALFGTSSVSLYGPGGRLLSQAVAGAAGDGLLAQMLLSGTYTLNVTAPGEAAATLTIGTGSPLVGNQGSSDAGTSQFTARTLGIVGPVPLTIAEWVGPANPSDWYALNVGSVAQLRISLTGAAAAVTVNLRSATGQLIASAVATPVTGASIVQTLGRAPGGYYLDVEGGAASGYALSIAAPPVPESAGATLAAAADLGMIGTAPAQVTDQLNAVDTIDFYQFHVAGPATAVVHASGLTGSATITLYDQYGAILATSIGGLGGDAWLDQDVAALPAGSSYALSVSAAQPTPYTLSLAAQGYAVTAASPATAPALGLLGGAPVSATGVLRTLNARQYYSFTLAAPATVGAALTASGSAQVQIFSAALAPVGQAAYQPSGPGTILATDQLGAGAYYAVVSAFNPAEAPGYTLTLSTGSPAVGTPATNSAGFTLATAALIGTLTPAPEILTDWVGPTDQHDFYRFTIGAESFARFDLTGLSAVASVTLEDTGGRFIATANGAQNGASLTTLLTAGDYDLDDSSADVSGTGYSLAASAMAVADQGGKSMATATALAPPSTAVQQETGYVSATIPDGFYQFTLAAPAIVNLLLSGTTAATTVSLLGHGALIASGQSAAVAGSSLAENGSVIQALAAGTYVVDVQASGPGVQPYTLSVSAVPAPVGGVTSASATPLGTVRDNNGLPIAQEDFGYRGSTITTDASLNHVVSSGINSDTLGAVTALHFLDGTLAFDVNGPGAQVTRLYQAALGRAPDQAGLGYWVRSVQAGAPLDALSSSFLGSAEFTARFGTLDNAGFVTRLYQNVLGRAPDPSGYTYWVNQLSAGETRANELTNFSESPENVTGTSSAISGGIWLRDDTAASIARLYDTVFGRKPDVAGLAYWLNNVEGGLQTMPQVTQAFISSPEFLATYGSLTNAAFVQGLYQNTLHRAPDNAGLTYWVGQLATGANSRATVVYSFADSAEHRANTASMVGGETASTLGIQFGLVP